MRFAFYGLMENKERPKLFRRKKKEEVKEEKLKRKRGTVFCS